MFLRACDSKLKHNKDNKLPLILRSRFSSPSPPRTAVDPAFSGIGQSSGQNPLWLEWNFWVDGRKKAFGREEGGAGWPGRLGPAFVSEFGPTEFGPDRVRPDQLQPASPNNLWLAWLLLGCCLVVVCGLVCGVCVCVLVCVL